MTRRPFGNRVVLGVVRSRAHRLLDGSVAALAYTGPRSGRRIELPVQYAAADGTVVLWPGHPEGKRWWRAFTTAQPVRLWLRGVERAGTAVVLRPGDADHETARARYAARFPRAAPDPADPLVRIDLQPLR